MYRLLEFLRSISLFVLFLLMEGAAIIFYAYSDSYTQAKLLGYSVKFTGGVMNTANYVGSYFSLHSENEMLLQRITKLEQQLEYQQHLIGDSILSAHSYADDLGIEYLAANVMSNSINRQKNFLMINRGLDDGVRVDMAVVSPQREIVGRVVQCTQHYSVVMSVLNTDFKTSGVLMTGNYTGSIHWEGQNRYLVRMDDLSKYAQIHDGLMVETAGFSQIFPSGITIGKVVNYRMNDAKTAYSADIELAVDISTIDEVLVINHRRSADGYQLLNDFNRGEGAADDDIK